MTGSWLRTRRAFISLLLAFAFIGLTASQSVAQFHEQSDKVGGVSTRVWQRWPQSASRGWMPIFVELDNQSASSQQVRIEAESGNYSSGGVRTAVELAPGERKRVELVVPLVGGHDWRSSLAYTVRIDANGDTTQQYNFGAIGSHANGSRPMMIFSGKLPEAGSAERWSSELSTAAVAENGGWQQFSGAVPAAEAGAVLDNVPIVAGTFDEMPQRMDAYSSLSAVVLENVRDLPAGSSLEELFAWVRLGGYLTLCGPGAEEFVRQREDLASWLEERFVITRDEVLVAYQFGFGRLIIAENATMKDASLRAGLREALRDWKGFLPDAPYSQLRSSDIPGVDDPPYLVFGFFLLLFAILIGPVNFIWVKKTKRPVLLLFTIPLISGAATLLLLGYGVLAQGIDTKQASTVLALLDQRANRVEFAQHTKIYVGLARKRGLAPGPRTVVAPIPSSASDDSTANNWSVREGAQRYLTGSYMPVREVGEHIVIAERSSRLGMEVRREGEGVRVTNNFEGDVENVALCDSNGAYWFAPGPLTPGQTISLLEIDTEAWRAHRLRWLRELGPDSLPTAYRILPDSYRVELDTSSFEDDLGLEATTDGGRHHVIGVLPEGSTR